MPPTFNHPITIRLAQTNISSGVNWTVANATDNVGHEVSDGVYPSDGISQIPNILNDVKLYADPDGLDSTISGARTEETSGVAGGGYYITAAANPSVTITGTVGSKNTINVLGNFSPFYSLARSAGATAFNLIIHGENDKGMEVPVYQEFSTVEGASQPKVFNTDFYKTSAFVTFNSKESIPPSLTSNTISFRKNYHHGLIALRRADMAGISQSNIINQFCYIYINGGNPQNIAAGLSANGNCTFNRYPSVGESSSASGTTPKSITCSNKLLQYIGIDGAALKFKNLVPFALYDTVPTTNAAAVGRIIAADQLFNTAPNPVDTTPYTLLATIPPAIPPVLLFLRPDYPVTLGSKNFLGIVRAIGDPRLFSTAQNPGDLNIQKNSYIRIRGSNSNDGIYQVLSIQDGVPNDTNEISAQGGLVPFQYLELSRDIVPEDAGARITIEDVTSLPVLHIKYLETV
jgi:hypothetical protein